MKEVSLSKISNESPRSQWSVHALPNSVVLMVVALMHLTIVLPSISPAPHNGGDNAGYLSLAHSMVTGSGFVELWDPETPPHTKYPPLYPALLAIAMLFGAEAWFTFKVLSALLVTTAIVLSFGWIRDRHGTGLAAGVALVLAFSPAFLSSASWILSDPLFLALTYACLWAFHRSECHDDGWKWVIGGSLAAVLATFTRTAGLPLVLAVGGALWARRQWRAFAGFTVAVLLPSLAWWLRARAAMGDAQYISEFWMIDPYQPDLGRAGIGDLFTRFVENLQGYVFIHIPAGLTSGSGPALGVLGLVIMTAAVVGLTLRLRNAVTVAELFAPLYFGLILAWPVVWSGDRFALPLYPLVLFYAGEAMLWGARQVHKRLPVAVGTLTLIMILLPSLKSWGESIGRTAECRRTVQTAGPFACYGEGFQQFVAAARWLGENAPEDSAVFSRKPRIFFTLSGVSSRTYPLSTDPERFFRDAADGGVSYVVLDRIDRLGVDYVGAVVREQPEAFCGLVSVGREDVRTNILGIIGEGVGLESVGYPQEVITLRPCPEAMVREEPRVLAPLFGISSTYPHPLISIEEP